MRSLALPNGSMPSGNTQNLSGTIHLLNGDLNARAQLTGAVGRVSRHDVRKILSPILGMCKWLDEWQPHDGEKEERRRKGREEGGKRGKGGRVGSRKRKRKRKKRKGRGSE